MSPSTERSANRLKSEKSPYLLQHATNPVDWHPWGAEAFETARAEDKPVFLSIGYSTCHWCHVMAHESFEDDEVAALINGAFVPIKVDREERPDIDAIYMNACQMMTGRGGWPLTIVMTPDGEPFFTATYVPKHGRFGSAGLVDLVPRLKELWVNRRDEVNAVGGRLARALQGAAGGTSHGTLDESTLRECYEELVERFDQEHGGFGAAPKFPMPHYYLFLLRYWKRTGEGHALAMVEHTLRALRRGGIYDQLGFGFFRYSTDERWLLPHFEKMLYSQALLAMAYTEAYQATGKAEYAQTTRQILEYVERAMTSAEGAFFSAEDADSEGVEGKFYLWTEAEIRAALDDDRAQRAVELFGVEAQGNVAGEATGEKTGANVLHMASSSHDRPPSVPDALRHKLFLAREQRVHPAKDDKVLADWNGLMIAALAKAARGLSEARYFEAAERALRFIEEHLMTDEGRLLHRYRDGEGAIPGQLDDYAYLVWGLIELYQATFDVAHLNRAVRLTETVLAHFADDAGGALFMTADDAERLLVRSKEFYDGAVPSGNSVMALNLLRLARLTGRTDLEERADALLRAMSSAVISQPTAHAQALLALDFAVGPSAEVVIAGDPCADDTQRMRDVVAQSFLPNTVVLLRSDRSDGNGLPAYARACESRDGKATAYVCRQGSCQPPTHDPGEVARLLGQE